MFVVIHKVDFKKDISGNNGNWNSTSTHPQRFETSCYVSFLALGQIAVVCQGAAEVSSTRQQPPWFNLRRPFGWVPRMSDP